MAWNPTPEVAVARDAAAKLGELAGTTVDRVVVLYTTTSGQIGYASYGQTKLLCNSAKGIADAAYDAAVKKLSRE